MCQKSVTKKRNRTYRMIHMSTIIHSHPTISMGPASSPVMICELLYRHIDSAECCGLTILPICIPRRHSSGWYRVSRRMGKRWTGHCVVDGLGNLVWRCSRTMIMRDRRLAIGNYLCKYGLEICAGSIKTNTYTEDHAWYGNRQKTPLMLLGQVTDLVKQKLTDFGSSVLSNRERILSSAL